MEAGGKLPGPVLAFTKGDLQVFTKSHFCFHSCLSLCCSLGIDTSLDHAGRGNSSAALGSSRQAAIR